MTTVRVLARDRALTRAVHVRKLPCRRRHRPPPSAGFLAKPPHYAASVTRRAAGAGAFVRVCDSGPEGAGERRRRAARQPIALLSRGSVEHNYAPLLGHILAAAAWQIFEIIPDTLSSFRDDGASGFQ
jgi:hypothetical protein